MEYLIGNAKLLTLKHTHTNKVTRKIFKNKKATKGKNNRFIIKNNLGKKLK
jgi:hypothetical protein